MRFRLLVLLFLVFSASTQATPIRYYFEGSIDVHYGVGMPEPESFHNGDTFGGWVDIDWDSIYPSDTYDLSAYVGHLYYKIFFGDGIKTISGGGHDMLYIHTKDFGAGLPDNFIDNYPRILLSRNILGHGSVPSVDDLYFTFNGSGGTIDLNYVSDSTNWAYDVKGVFHLVDEFVVVPVPEPSALMAFLSALFLLIILRLRSFNRN